MNLPIDEARISEINQKYWGRIVAAMNAENDRGLQLRDALIKKNALAPSRRHRLRRLMKDGSGQFWVWSGTPNYYFHLETNEMRDERELPTPRISGTFPEQPFGWEPCATPGEASEVEKNEILIAQLVREHHDRKAFIDFQRDACCAAVVAYARKTLTERVRDAKEDGRDETAWSNRGDGAAIAQALAYDEDSTAGRTLQGDGSTMIVTLHHWLEELSGLEPAQYLI